MIEFHCQITPREFVQAQYLHIRPRPWINWIKWVLFLWYCVVLGYFLLAAILLLNQADPPPIVILGMIAAGVYLVGWYLWYIPWRAHRVYQQLKALQSPYKMRLSEEGIFAKNEHGESLTPWSHVYKWKEDRHLFLVYHAEVVFQMIPKHCIASESEAEALRELLRSHAKQEA